MLFDDQDRRRIAAAIGSAEATTAGEIVVIVSSERYRYAATALTLAALLALAFPLLPLVAGISPASLWPDWDSIDTAARERRGLEILIAGQAIVFVATLALVHLTGLGRLLTPKGLRHDRVHQAALTQFKARGFEATTGRTGVLIYLSEPEHIAEVIADTAVFAKVSPDHWGATVGALIDGIKAGKPGDGMVAAIGLAGAVLAQHFPYQPDDVNELPDRLIEI
jgi:putative membrane protein